MYASQQKNPNSPLRFPWPAFRFGALFFGLSAVALANFTVAPSLSSETPAPIRDAPADFFRSEGWGRASYIALGWWLSSEFENVEVHHAGFSGSRVGISFREHGSPVDAPLISDDPVLVYNGDWSRLHQEIAGDIRTPRDQTIFCRIENNSEPMLCDLSVAWREPGPGGDRIIFDVVFSGKDDFLMIERGLFESLPREFGASVSGNGA